MARTNSTVVVLFRRLTLATVQVNRVTANTTLPLLMGSC